MNKNSQNPDGTSKTIHSKSVIKIIPVPVCIAAGIIIGIFANNLALWLCIGVAIGASFMVNSLYHK